MSEANSRIRVLIAEDERTVREALATLIDVDDSLELVGVAADADEAIARARDERPDVALVDVKMPGGGGPRATREIKSSSPQTRVVALSAYDDRSTVLEMLRAGAAGYLVKGTPGAEIIEAIRRSMRGQASLSTEVTSEVIHELVELLDRSERMARQLQDLDRVKSELIQVLSHELMTPITVIQGAASTISGLRRGLSADDATSLAASVARATQRLRRLVGNLSATARLDRDDADIVTKPTPARDVVTMAANEFTDAQHRLLLPSGRDTGAELWADLQLAAQALVVLVENALEHTPGDQPVEVDVQATSREVRVLVADRGPGVPADLADRIFGAFTQADASATRAHEGLGIGLYLARKIMAAHDGGVDLRPRRGGGSVFVLTFPAAPPGDDR